MEQTKTDPGRKKNHANTANFIDLESRGRTARAVRRPFPSKMHEGPR